MPLLHQLLKKTVVKVSCCPWIERRWQDDKDAKLKIFRSSSVRTPGEEFKPTCSRLFDLRYNVLCFYVNNIKYLCIYVYNVVRDILHYCVWCVEC